MKKAARRRTFSRLWQTIHSRPPGAAPYEQPEREDNTLLLRHDRTGAFQAPLSSIMRFSKRHCAFSRLHFFWIPMQCSTAEPPCQAKTRTNCIRPGSCSGVGLLIDVLQLVVQHPGVDLSGGDVRVPHHLLDGAQVRPVLQQVGGEGVAQGVGRDVLLDAGLLLVVFDQLPEALASGSLMSCGRTLRRYSSSARMAAG